ncbi:MAG: ornithine cyclodeaminase family protein [Anaerolineae bacterium]|nr:ornithine cyclodeaminase family protein [Anaerolineae bacterium]
MSLLVMNEDELRQTVTMPETIEAIKTAFMALAEDRISMPGAFTLDLPQAEAQVQAKGTYLSEAPYYTIKVKSNFRNNPALNLPADHSLIAVFDAQTGFPVAIMVDNGYLTAIRAAAAGALTALYLANEQLGRVAVIGSGRQAYMQIKALRHVRNFSLVSVWGHTPVNVDSYARLIVEDYDLDVEIAPSVEAAVAEADLIVTTTASQQPLLRSAWLKPGVHIIAMGSDNPAKQELHPDVLQRADIIIADSIEQSSRRGEIHHALTTGAITLDDIQGELGNLLLGKIAGRTDPQQITVADLTGLDVQESTVATLALKRAQFLGLGQHAENPAAHIPTGPID